MAPSALIAEDEPLLRREVREQLARAWPELVVVAEAEDGPAALAAFEAHGPQVLFLDVQMPGMTGLEVARAVGGRAHVVFITAFDQFAIEAFENEAVDYLLKPVTDERMAATVERLKRRLDAPPPPLERMLEQLAASLANGRRQPLRWITASQGRHTRLVMIEDVVYFQSDNKYTRVVTADSEALIRTPLRQLLEELDGTLFRQVHRSTVVNLAHVKTLERDDAGRCTLTLKTRPETLAVSEAYTHLFRQM